MTYVIKYEDEEYPKLLKYIKDPPKVLYCSGNKELLSRKAVAIVGSRNASLYGMEMAGRLAEYIGNCNVCVVSGMAKGIDWQAHTSSINTEGSTIAVLGCGILAEKNRERIEFIKKIAETGLVISEYEDYFPPARYTYPRRNRIISGISICTAVIEAGFNSGSLITAELAAEQGRCVYALPGNIDSPMSLGTNRLIKDGAVPITAVSDITMDMGIYNSKKTSMGNKTVTINI